MGRRGAQGVTDIRFHLIDFRLVAGVRREGNRHPLGLDFDILDQAGRNDISPESRKPDGPQQAPHLIRFVVVCCQGDPLSLSQRTSVGIYES